MSRKSSINKIKRSNKESKNIESALVMNLYLKGHSPISTHATIRGLSECDVISISKSDFIYEYEVKISKSDFKRDFIKEKHTLIKESKFTQLSSDNSTWYFTPNYYYFVVPENLISIEEIPSYSGLIYFKEDMSFDVIKKAPVIHKVKADNNFIRSLSHQLTCKLVFNKVK